MAKYKAWGRKRKIKNLAGNLTTDLSFAVIGSPEKFLKKLHAYKVFLLLQSLGAKVYPISPDIEKLGKTKVNPNLLALQEKVEVVIPCLPNDFTLSILAEAKEAGVKKIWFQPNTNSEELFQFCRDNKMEIIEGCALMYKEFDSVLKFVDPCFWHSKTFARKQN